MFINVAESVTLTMFFIGWIAIHARLSQLVARDTNYRGMSGLAVGALTFFAAPLGLAAWAWVRGRPLSPSAVGWDPLMEIIALLIALIFIGMAAMAFGLTGCVLACSSSA